MLRLSVERSIFLLIFFLSIFANTVQAEKKEPKDFVSIFNGKSLKEWDGDPRYWRIENGTLTGETTPKNILKESSYIIWKGGEPGNFILKLEYRILSGNSGIQYRSYKIPGKKWDVGGYQADLEAGKKYSGILYDVSGRTFLGMRGEKTVIGADHKPKVTGSVGNSDEIQSQIRDKDWNEYTIIAKGNHLVHKINNAVTVDVTDNDKEKRRSSGLLGFQLHQGPPMKVQFRNIRIKHLN